MTNELSIKVESAIKLIKAAAPADGSPIEVCYSGGKDSDIILDLTKKSGVNYIAYYKNTTIDPPGTINHCLKNNVFIIQPKLTFLQLIENHGMPTRRVRHCCRYLKEYKILDTAIQGIRRVESVKRSKLYNPDDPIICRIYGSKKNHVSVVLPILNWSDEDVFEYISENHIECHPLYYNNKGEFNVSKRLGCLGCPLQSDNGVNDYLQYPTLLKTTTKSLLKWWYTHPSAKSHQKFSTPYGLLAHNLFFRTYHEYLNDTFTLFGETDWKKYIEQYFKIKLQ